MRESKVSRWVDIRECLDIDDHPFKVDFYSFGKLGFHRYYSFFNEAEDAAVEFLNNWLEDFEEYDSLDQKASILIGLVFPSFFDWFIAKEVNGRIHVEDEWDAWDFDSLVGFHKWLERKEYERKQELMS